MEKKWTNEQIDAIKSNNNIFISASAGSGKTSVLVERIIYQIINNNKNISNFLILTYTKKAAYEIKSRLLDRLYLLLNDSSTSEIQQKKILEQIILLPNSDITTIHAFCFKIIKEKNVILNINDIEINNNVEFNINNEEKEKLLEYLYVNSDCFVQKNIFVQYDKILNYSNDLYLKSILNINPKKYLLNLNNKYNIDYWISKSQKLILEKINFIKNILKSLNHKIKSENEILLDELINEFNNKKQSYENFIILCNKIIEIKLDKKFDKFFYKIINDIFIKIKNCIYDKIYIIKDINIHIMYTNILVNCTMILLNLRKNFKQKKATVNISFSDLEHLVIKLINKNLINDIQYTDIVIDEFQDTNEVQDYILKNIKCNNYFYVGDVKQCIYEFRSANTNIFQNKSKYFIKANKNNNVSNKFISLNKNFRSTNKIIRTINNIFLFIMNKDFAGIEYKNEILSENNNEGKYKVEIDILNINDKIFQLEYIVKKIVNIININKTIKAKDIVILFRNINNQQKLFFLGQILIKNGFEMICNRQNKFINQIEIKTIINLLRIIKNPYDDIYIIGCLLSPLFAFSIDEIIKIKQFDIKTSFYENLINMQSINKKINIFINILDNLRSKNFLLSKLIDEIYNLTSALSIFGRMINGDIKQKNLNNLILIVQKYDNRYDSIDYFIEKIDDMIKNNQDFPNIKFEETNENAISVMSVHEAKGLEFKVVILAEINKKFNITDIQKSIIIHNKYGIGVKYKTIINNEIYDNKSIIYDFIKKNIYHANIKEELRILYVALTRAVEKLIIIGLDSNIDKKIEYWSYFLKNKFLKNFLFEDISSYLPLILIPFIKNGVLHSNQDTQINIIKDFDENNSKEEKKLQYQKKQIQIINKNEYKIHQKIKKIFNYNKSLDINSQIKSKITPSSNNINNLTSWTLTDNNYNMKLGNEYHKIMQFIKFDNNIDYNYININQEIERLLKLNILNANLCSRINRNNLLKFFQSRIYKEILNSSKFWREFRFTIVENLSNDSSLIQGIIDVVYIYKNKISIVDFKSDKILYDYDFYIKKYSKQLNIYHKAVNEIFKIPFDKKILYFFNTGEYVLI